MAWHGPLRCTGRFPAPRGAGTTFAGLEIEAELVAQKERVAANVVMKNDDEEAVIRSLRKEVQKAWEDAETSRRRCVRHSTRCRTRRRALQCYCAARDTHSAGSWSCAGASARCVPRSLR